MAQKRIVQEGAFDSTVRKQIDDNFTELYGSTASGVAGVAAGYAVARGVTALDGSNPTTIVTGLTSITGFAATLNRSTSLATGTAFVTYNNISGGSVDVYAWVVAGTASTGTENVSWVAIGTI